MHTILSHQGIIVRGLDYSRVSIKEETKKRELVQAKRGWSRFY